MTLRGRLQFSNDLAPSQSTKKMYFLHHSIKYVLLCLKLQNLTFKCLALSNYYKRYSIEPKYTQIMYLVVPVIEYKPNHGRVYNHCYVNLPSNTTMKVLKFSLYLTCLGLTLERAFQCLQKFNDQPVGTNIKFDSFVNQEMPR